MVAASASVGEFASGIVVRNNGEPKSVVLAETFLI